MEIVVDDLDGDEVRALLLRHAEGMEANSPAGTCHYLDASGLRTDDVTVWSVWDDGRLAGVGALREIEPTHGEVKSMRTADAHLGRGVGRALLEHIVDVATNRGYVRLSLETGSTPAFDAARRLYERFGFEPAEPFGDYEPNGFSRFYTMSLSRPG